MTTRYSLRKRATWSMTSVVSIFVVLLCTVSYLVFSRMEDKLVNAVLDTEAQHLKQQRESGVSIPAEKHTTERGSRLQVWHIATPADLHLLPPPLRSIDRNGTYLLKPADRTWHVFVMPARTGRLYVLYDATSHEKRVHQFGLILLMLGTLSIAASYLLARWLAGLIVGPVMELADRLSHWAPGSRDTTVRRDDESAQFVEAFNRMQNRIEESIAFEREFASNLGHEIRTMLAAIRSDTEMLQIEATTPDEQRDRRLRRLLRQVDAIGGSLTSAEKLGHLDEADIAPAQLRQLMDEAWLAVEHEARQRGLSFINDIPDTLVMPLDAYALLMVARNLIRNAAEHASASTLTVGWDGVSGITFADDGSGIPAEHVPLIFERYYRAGRRDSTAGADGRESPARRGLGLAIAKQICDRHGWGLGVSTRASGPMAGTTFTLDLHPAPISQ